MANEVMRTWSEKKARTRCKMLTGKAWVLSFCPSRKEYVVRWQDEPSGLFAEADASGERVEAYEYLPN